MKRLIGIGLVLGLFLFAGVAQAATISVPTEQATLQAAIDAANVDGSDTIVLTENVVLTQQVNVNKAVTIDGNGKTLSASFPRVDNSNNSAIGIQASGVTIKNITVDGTGGSAYPLQLHGINVYLSTGVNLENVTILNFGGSGVVVNGSEVTATNLNTSGNSWDGVNVDPGSGVTAPSVFTLNSGNLAEDVQIKSDGDHVSDTATVAVNASGYTEHSVFGTSLVFWTNRALTSGVTVEGSNVVYSSIQTAIDAAADAGVIKLNGDMTTTALVLVNKALTIDGNGHTLFAPIDNTANNNANNAGIGIVGATGAVVINNLTVDGSGSSKIHGINVFESSNVTLNSVTVKNNTKAGITVNGSNVTANNVTTLNNAWGGINADQAADAPSATVLTVTGSSAHTEAGPDMWRDDNSKQVTVNLNGQYSQANYTHDTDVVGTVFTLIDQVAVSGSNPQVEVTSSTQPISVTVDVSVTQPSLDVSALITTPGKATLPQISIQSDNVDVSIPASTVVTSSDTSWNGIINAPTVVSAPVISASSGQVATAALAIEVGSGDTALTFDQPVKLTFAGQAGKLAGWVRGGVFSTISDVCDNATNPTLVGEECKIDVGADLVVWTKHFTTFVTYTESAKPVSTPSSSAARRASNLASVGAGAAASTPAASVSAAGGEVLGAFTGPVDLSEVAAIKLQLIGLIQQLIGLLQAQLAVALAAEAN